MHAWTADIEYAFVSLRVRRLRRELAVLLVAIVVTSCSSSRAGAIQRCDGSEFAVALGALSEDPPGQFHRRITLTSQHRSCWVQGYPEVELIAARRPFIYQLRNSVGATPRIVVTPPNPADFIVTYLPFEPVAANRAFDPTFARINLPGSTFPLSVAWVDGPVLDQEQATHPGTYVGPIEG